MLTINISQINKLPIGNKNDCLLDITNTINQSGKLKISDFFNSDKIFEEALSLYKNFINQIISDKKTTSCKIHNLSIYWLSETGSKHPITHWGKDFCLLVTILKYSSSLIQRKFQQVTLILPSEISCFEKAINKLLFSYKYNIKVKLLFLSSVQRKTNYISLLKASLSVVKSILLYRNKKQPRKITSSNYYLINSLRDKHTYDVLYLELKKIFELEKKNLTIIPILEWQHQHHPSSETPQEFIDEKPNFFDLLNTLLQISISFVKIKLSDFKKIKIDGINFNVNFLQHDLLSTLKNKSHLIFLHIWLIKFFKKHNGIFIYSDEFYPSGRTISSSINNSKNQKAYSFGIQHGHFNEIQTVYTLTDKEISKGLPLPNKFIVWGEYYRDIFKKNNSIKNNLVLPLGNPKYINLEKKIAFENKSNKIKNVLWCLTSMDCFIAEWDIIKNSLILSDLKLTIRLHPIAHISIEDLSKIIENIKYTVSNNKSLSQDFFKADLILTSAHSTIFLDALTANKKVVRIITNRWIGKGNFKSDFVFNVKNSEELKHLLLKLDKTTHDKVNNFLEIKNNKWREFLNSYA
jgi:hypothetical protein